MLIADTETTGIDKSQDQILQFAALRIEVATMKVVEEINLRCELREDVVPAPEAILTTHIDVNNHQGSKEYEFALKVHQHLLDLNYPDTFITGYNFTEFDNKILQHLFYRNGIDPYMHQYKNGNVVGDLYAFVRLVFARNRKAIVFPDLDGKPSLKLDRMVPANNIVVEGAYHDALTDCHATYELLKLLIKNSKAEWDDFCFSLNKFNIERSLKQYDKKTKIAFHNDPFYGKKNSFTKPFSYLGDYKNGQFIMVNLLAPLKKYIEMGAEKYRELESQKKFNEMQRMFITPFYSSKPLFSICNKEEYEASFHNCDLKFDDLKPNLDYVNEKLFFNRRIL